MSTAPPTPYFSPDRPHLAALADLAAEPDGAAAWEAAVARGHVPLEADPRRAFVRHPACGDCHGTGAVTRLGWAGEAVARLSPGNGPVFGPSCPRRDVDHAVSLTTAPSSGLEALSIASTGPAWLRAEELAREASRRMASLVRPSPKEAVHLCRFGSERVVWRVVDRASWWPALHNQIDDLSPEEWRDAWRATPYGLAFSEAREDAYANGDALRWLYVLRASGALGTPVTTPAVLRLTRDERENMSAAELEAEAGRTPHGLTVEAELYLCIAADAAKNPDPWRARSLMGSALRGKMKVNEWVGNPFEPIDQLNRLGFVLHDVTADGVEIACPRALPDAAGWWPPLSPRTANEESPLAMARRRRRVAARRA